MEFGFDFSAFAAPIQTDPATGTVAILQVFLQPALLLAAFSMLMSDFFDTMGSVVAIGQQADFVDEDGNVEGIGRILTVDALGAIVGGFLGSSSITAFVESSSGVAAGARTGFANLVTGFLFIVCAFCAPVIGMVSSSATCGALVVVGFLMMSNAGSIDWGRIEHAFPAFLAIVMIPLTYSITTGIGFSFIAYVLVMVFTGKVRDVKPLMWVASIAFVVMFALS